MVALCLKIVGPLEGGDLMKEVNHGGGVKWGWWVGFGVCCKIFLPNGETKHCLPPALGGINNKVKFHSTKVHPGEPMSLLSLLTDHE